jgi:transcriptional regulator with XRE-family HTH domain
MPMPPHAQLRFWRRARNLTQQTLATRADICQSWLHSLEAGEYPIREPLRTTLATLLDIPVEWLSDDSPDLMNVTAMAGALAQSWGLEEDRAC